MEREDSEGRLENRIQAPWENTEEENLPYNNDKHERQEERKKKRSMKVRNYKEKIGNIDINILQRELSKLSVQLVIRSNHIFNKEKSLIFNYFSERR